MNGSMKLPETLRANASTFEKYKKPTKREKFSRNASGSFLRKELYALIDPFYPKAGKGRPPVGLERMLRIHFLAEAGFNLSDPAAEEEPSTDMESIEALRRYRSGNELCSRRDHHLQVPSSSRDS